jgi:hypothetical protein
MKTKVEIITPKMAMDWLEHHNPKNRPISETTVQSYAQDMKNKRWLLTHQGIAFNEDGHLIDGQHRLWAIVMADVEIEMSVTRGIPRLEIKNGVEINPMDSIDRTRVRTTGQQMQLCHSIKNGNSVAAAVRGIISIIAPNYGSNRISTANSLFVYDLYGKDVEAILDHLHDSRKFVSYYVAPLAMYYHGEPEKAVEFCRQMHTLENLSAPVRTLIKWIEAHPGKMDAMTRTRVVANAILYFHENKTISRLHEGPEGSLFLTGMFPSLAKRIRDAVKPITGVQIVDFSNNGGKKD